MSEPILRTLILKRFRSLPAEVVEFDNPTFLVGQNGSGKSNFADAFAFLAEAMASPLQAVLARRGGLSTVGNRGSARGRPSNMGLSVLLQQPDTDTVEARYGFELSSVGDYGFKVLREQCIVRRTDGPSSWFDRSGPDANWSSNVGSLDPVLESNALALPLVGGDTRFQSVLRFLSRMQICHIEPTALRDMQDPDEGMRLHPDGRNAASVLREIEDAAPENWQTILELLERIVPRTVGVQPKKHDNKLTLEFSQDFGKRELVKFGAFSMSDGTLRVLGMLAAVFQRSSPSLLVIEEPEATIHPGALGSILDVLRHTGRSMQVVVTTHSPDILDAKWIEDRHLRIAQWEAGKTRITSVSPSVRQALAEHLMGAGELLRANALTAAELFVSDPHQLDLFSEGELS
ncbi:MAG: AAA family ATPase [Caldilineaceae bacterium SB0665_bin_25]|nr:AAA family ATPase [Caldilineaceae bacterium SB0665_bin_25]